ncbi:MAG TPA: hypothetical protein VJ182_01195 [Anaerolineales bacterium]|nr:hypothetical protein [Anaerolineales bacterium]
MENSGYMILGFTVVFTAIFLHLASLALRSRNLARDLELLEKINKKSPKRKLARKKKLK